LLDELRALVTIPAPQFRERCAELGLATEDLVSATPPSAEASPSLWFPAEFVAWAAELGALIDVDVLLHELAPDDED
jgi:hypothetical protein